MAIAERMFHCQEQKVEEPVYAADLGYLNHFSAPKRAEDTSVYVGGKHVQSCHFEFYVPTPDQPHEPVEVTGTLIPQELLPQPYHTARISPTFVAEKQTSDGRTIVFEEFSGVSATQQQEVVPV